MAEFPQVLTFEAGDETDAARDLVDRLGSVGVEAPFVVASAHGEKLTSALHSRAEVVPPKTADVGWAADLGSTVKRSGASCVVAVGGGRVLDLAKLAAARAGMTVVAVPTQLSHDGICSPVAVVPDESGVTQSLGAIAPRVVYLSLPTLRSAPVATVRAGLGDLIANPLALRDWSLAIEHGLSEPNQEAWDLSVESFERIEPYLDSDARHNENNLEFLHTLADALVLSGKAMICSGNSRPASGAEHEISHALDYMFQGRALHGAQVAFGSIFSIALYGGDVPAFRERLARLGLPHHYRQLLLSENDVVRLLLAAPDTRPGRFTVLEDANLDESSAVKLVHSIWTH
ncbi:MAG: iron-containing alcohol dehydrogenase [Actinomycetota bacterium]